MTKKELEARIVELEKQVRSLQSQLNNVVRPAPAPIFVQPYPGPNQTQPQPKWIPFNVCASLPEDVAVLANVGS